MITDLSPPATPAHQEEGAAVRRPGGQIRALHGPHLGGRKTYLFAFLDDRSRAVMAARFGFHEDTVRLAVTLRPALAARGVPGSIYVDNGQSSASQDGIRVKVR